MSELLAFPQNGQTFYKKALRAIENNELTKAWEFISKSLAIELNDTVLEDYVYLANQLQKRSELKDFWERNAQFRFVSQKTCLAYLNSFDLILPLSQRLLQCFEMKQEMTAKSFNVSQVDEQIKHYLEIDLLSKKLDEAYRKDKFVSFCQIFTQEAIFKQLKDLKKIYLLPLELILPLLKQLLVHKSTYQFIKSDILHYLIHQRYHEEIEILSLFSNRFKLVPSQISSYKTDSEFLRHLKILKDYFEQQDPHLESMMLEQFVLLYSGLYPTLLAGEINAQHLSFEFLSEYGLVDGNHKEKENQEAFKLILDEIKEFFL